MDEIQQCQSASTAETQLKLNIEMPRIEDSYEFTLQKCPLLSPSESSLDKFFIQNRSLRPEIKDFAAPRADSKPKRARATWSNNS
jgi:hypothetical protein